MKKIYIVIMIILILSVPNIVSADNDFIIFLVDELSLEKIEELSLDKHNLGFVNLKTRSPYSKEGLYLSINTGRKLSYEDFQYNEDVQYLKDILKNEKTAYLGEGKAYLTVSNAKENVDYKGSFKYNINDFIEQTNSILSKADLLAIEYDFKEMDERYDLFQSILEYYEHKNILILPKKVADSDKKIINEYIVPIVYITNDSSGILTSASTKRTGFIALEDISVEIKNQYNIKDDTDIGTKIKIIDVKNNLNEFNNIYKKTINLVYMAGLQQGIVYLVQIILGICILRKIKISKNIISIYAFATVNLAVGFLISFLNLQQNLLLTVFISLGISYLIIKYLKLNRLKHIIIFTYIYVIVITLIGGEILYNSPIGFNNLVYGARFYGLNNGMMALLLASSILTYKYLNINNERLKRIVGIIIFSLNIVVLSGNFGANTGGFITSLVLLIVMLYTMFFSNTKINLKILLALIALGIGLFTINMFIDGLGGESSHAFRFFQRIGENGLNEIIYIISFKAKELFKLIIMPPFSIALIAQIIILNHLKEIIYSNKTIKKEAMIFSITSLTALFINDTGNIALIFMINYFILDILYENFNP